MGAEFVLLRVHLIVDDIFEFMNAEFVLLHVHLIVDDLFEFRLVGIVPWIWRIAIESIAFRPMGWKGESSLSTGMETEDQVYCIGAIKRPKKTPLLRKRALCPYGFWLKTWLFGIVFFFFSKGPKWDLLLGFRFCSFSLFGNSMTRKHNKTYLKNVI